MYSSRDNWERLVTAVVRKQQIWELFHDHSRSPSISTIASSDDDDDHFNQQFLDKTWTETATSVSLPAPLPFNNPPSSVSQVANTSGAITRNLFPANWYRGKKAMQDYRTDIPGVRRFSLHELKIATDSFSDSNVSFRNGFFKLYKGQLENGFIVAIKKFEHRDISRAQTLFKAEVGTMRIVVHQNLLCLVGFCSTQKENLLVYQQQLQQSKYRSDSNGKSDFSVKSDGVIRLRDRICVPHDENIRKLLLQVVHQSTYSVHSGKTKMYKDLHQMYWWPGMKKDVIRFVAECLTCQQVKAEHHRQAGLLKPLVIPKCKWDRITMDFVQVFPKS